MSVLTRTTINSTASRIQTYVLAHKILAACATLVVIGGGYYAYSTFTSTAGETRYVLAVADQGAIVATISATGQVSASNQIDLKPKAGGDVVYLNAAAGQFVRAGTLIASLDASNAQKSVRDAQLNLESAQLALQKLGQPADAVLVTQAQNALSQTQDDLTKQYDTSFNVVSNTFLDLPAVITGINDILYGTTVSRITGQANIAAYVDMVTKYDETAADKRAITEAKYLAAQASYKKALADYGNLSRTSDITTIEAVTQETYDTTKAVSESVKATNDFLNFIKDVLTRQNLSIPSQLATHQASLSTYTSQTNSHLSDLFATRASIESDKRSIVDKTASLEKLKAGTDPLDVQSQQLTIKQRENALLDAQQALSDSYVRAPFDGTLASVAVKKYDSISSGTVVATLITAQELAELSVNEVDAAKIKVGQKATLTFDAIDELTLTGKVVELGSVGTVAQGVVSYAVKIALDTQDSRVKPGMSVSASIITDSHQDVVRVPSSAVKTSGDSHSVEMIDGATDTSALGVLTTTPPRQIPVEVGISDDTYVEITSGIKEGDLVVIKTTTGTPVKAATAALSLFGGGARTTGGAAGRTISR